MAKKTSKLDAKLGSWTDQVNLSRAVTPEPARESYEMQRSLMDRVADAAKQNDQTEQELIGYLLTWALDQVESGQHKIAKSSAEEDDEPEQK